MNNKILMGSIIAVAILVLVSFTGVVGYQTTKLSTIAKASPLFTVRSSRAIDEESKDFTCDYVGKGEGTSIHFSTYTSRNIRLQKVIDFTSRMDNKTFNSYLNLIINKIRNNDKYGEVNINEAITTIQQIRNNPQTIILDESNKNNIDTIGFDFYPTLCWFPGCIPLKILEGIITIFFVIVMLYGFLFLDWTSSPVDCGYSPT